MAQFALCQSIKPRPVRLGCRLLLRGLYLPTAASSCQLLPGVHTRIEHSLSAADCPLRTRGARALTETYFFFLNQITSSDTPPQEQGR